MKKGRGAGQGTGRVRIIAGAAKGLRLAVPPGRRVRPTPDRVRESLFSIIGFRCEGALVLDCCAGSGALGLEALSRGAESVLFVEQDRHIAKTLVENVDSVGLDGARVLIGDVIKQASKLSEEGLRFDLVFIDPPYAKNLFVPIVEALIEAELLASEALVVIEHPAEGSIDVPALRRVDSRRYGSVTLDFFESE